MSNIQYPTSGPTPSALVDTHCHLIHPDFDPDRHDVLERAQQVGVREIICPGYDLPTSEAAVRLASEMPGVHAAVGIHPHHAETFDSRALEAIRKLASDENVVAIGETGLDYYRDLSPREVQREAFRAHIRLARDLGLPLIVHSRAAEPDVLAVLNEEGAPPRGLVMHCLPNDQEFARGSLEMGCYLGLGGSLTFKSAVEYRQLIKDLPLDRILLETDAPYLAPEPHRGKRNEPSYLAVTAARLAEVKGISLEEVAAACTANAHKLFAIE